MKRLFVVGLGPGGRDGMTLEAKKALEQGARPAEAALAAGFSDQSHFTNFFSRCTGITPGAYREIFLDKLPETECGKERNQKI